MLCLSYFLSIYLKPYTSTYFPRCQTIFWFWIWLMFQLPRNVDFSVYITAFGSWLWGKAIIKMKPINVCSSITASCVYVMCRKSKRKSTCFRIVRNILQWEQCTLHWDRAVWWLNPLNIHHCIESARSFVVKHNWGLNAPIKISMTQPGFPAGSDVKIIYTSVFIVLL